MSAALKLESKEKRRYTYYRLLRHRMTQVVPVTVLEGCSVDLTEVFDEMEVSNEEHI